MKHGTINGGPGNNQIKYIVEASRLGITVSVTFPRKDFQLNATQRSMMTAERAEAYKESLLTEQKIYEVNILDDITRRINDLGFPSSGVTGEGVVSNGYAGNGSARRMSFALPPGKDLAAAEEEIDRQVKRASGINFKDSNRCTSGFANMMIASIHRLDDKIARIVDRAVKKER